MEIRLQCGPELRERRHLADKLPNIATVWLAFPTAQLVATELPACGPKRLACCLGVLQ